jgi:hypothetical protein
MHTFHSPFHMYRGFSVIPAVLSGWRPERPTSDGCFKQIPPTNECWRLIQDCWSQESHDRPSIGIVIERLQDINSSATTKDDTNSLGATDLNQRPVRVRPASPRTMVTLPVPLPLRSFSELAPPHIQNATSSSVPPKATRATHSALRHDNRKKCEKCAHIPRPSNSSRILDSKTHRKVHKGRIRIHASASVM